MIEETILFAMDALSAWTNPSAAAQGEQASDPHQHHTDGYIFTGQGPTSRHPGHRPSGGIQLRVPLEHYTGPGSHSWVSWLLSPQMHGLV